MLKLKKIEGNIIQKHLEYCRSTLLLELEELKEKPIDQEKLDKCINNFDNLITSSNLEELIEEYNNFKKDDEISGTFLKGYERFGWVNKTLEWNRHLFISALNMTSCPYCGRQYITSYAQDIISENNINDHTTAEADHFYPKADYYFLSLNIYNLIPSCQVCNRHKSSKKIKLYPYEEEFGNDAVFRVFLNGEKTHSVLPSTEKEFIVKIDIQKECEEKKKGAIERNIEVFKLNKVYKTAHNKYVKDMLETFESHSKEYLDEINELLSVEDENKEILNSMLKDMLKKPYIFKIENEEPLGKLTNDILKSYGILEEDE